MVQDYKISRLDPEKDIDFLNDLHENMRLQDLEEMAAMGLTDSRKELMDTVLASVECFKVVDGSGRAITAYGVIKGNEVNPGGQVWCLGTYLLNIYALPFTRNCKKVFVKWLKEYDQLWNFVSKENTLSLRWLKACGAEFQLGIMYNGHRFYKFIVR